jgi:hypothetical protein
MESQGAGMVVVNENLANLIPAVPIVAGAGGLSCDFDGGQIGERKLIDGRCSVIHAANSPLRERLLDVIARAREIARQPGSAPPSA